MLTSLSLFTDRSEYSRFETTRAVIRVRVVPNPAAGLSDETVTVTLKRKTGEVVTSQVITLTGDAPKGQIVEIDLREVKDENGIPLCIRGDYEVEASQDGGPSASVSVRVALITVEAVRTTYCRGVTLYSSEILRPVKQPVLVTGVTITNASKSVKDKSYILSYDKDAGTLSWAGGAAVTLDASVTTEILPDTVGGYVEVSIDHFELPDATVDETIFIDNEKMTDDAIRDLLEQAIAETENDILKVYLEPMRIATEPYYSAPKDGQYFDKKVDTLAFYSHDYNLQALAWHLNLPVSQLLRVDRIQGFMGNTAALEINNGAFAINRASGTVDVLPFNNQYSYLWTWFVNQRFWGVRSYIADFWRYQGMAGLEVCPPDVLKLVGYVCAVTILTIAGQAYRGGYSSEATSKDGVSRSVSYTASAIYGIYSATITEYKEWLKKNQSRIGRMYRGIQMVVL